MWTRKIVLLPSTNTVYVYYLLFEMEEKNKKKLKKKLIIKFNIIFFLFIHNIIRKEIKNTQTHKKIKLQTIKIYCLL